MFGSLATGGIAFGCCAVLTGFVYRYAIARGILDIPNRRSSHTSATPRGGGLSIACGFLAGTVVLGLLGIVQTRLALALVGGGALVGAVGWMDDKHGLSVQQRAVVHAIASVWAVSLLKGLPTLTFGHSRIVLGFVGDVAAVVGVMWVINLYNFMDGIDGLAASEAVAVGVVAGVLLLLRGSPLAYLCLLLAGSAGGFLVWNWPPAKIFMGDVSSGLIGFVLAVLAIAAENSGVMPLVVWILMLSVFVVDATATLIRRVANGERWSDPHRTHAYQLAIQAGLSHREVTALVLAFDGVLALLALLASVREELQLPALLVALGGCYLIWRRMTRRFLPARPNIARTDDSVG